MTGRGVAVVGGAVLAAAAALTLGLESAGGAAHAANSGVSSLTTTAVVRTDLAATEQVAGSIGYDGAYTVLNPAGASAQAITQAQQALAQAESARATDQTAASDTDAASTQAIEQAQSALAAAETALNNDQSGRASDCAGSGASSPACMQDGQKVTQDQQQLAQQEGALASARLAAIRSGHQDTAKLDQDATAIENAAAALAVLQRSAVNPGSVYTSVPAPGAVITRGQSLYSVDGVPVPLFYGTATMWRDFMTGMSDGPDVAALTANLIALGYGRDLVESDHFSSATGDAVRRWQAAIGAPVTGLVRLGEVQFEPGAIRVSDVHATAGSAATPGPVLDATSVARVVTVALTVDKEYLVHAGDVVSVLLPDGKSTTAGHVRDISTVATTPSGGNGGGSGSQTPTVTVTITLDHPGETGNLDQAPVQVNITDQAVHGVLAVPINALVALAEGGDAVEVVSGSGASASSHLVAVQTGLFSDSMVQIEGAGITAGTLVEVPAS